MLSDRGRVRRSNEDICVALPGSGVFVVCDGMGGAAGGEVASHLAAEIFLTCLSQPELQAVQEQARDRARVQVAVEAANRAIFQQAQHTPQLAGMGTTLVGLFHHPVPAAEPAAGSSGSPSLWLVHVGDSRCYRWRHRRLERLTRDHSLVEEQVRAGQITAAQAVESPMRNFITRAVGSQARVEPEIHGYCPQQGDLYLLASDGLTRELSDEEIGSILEGIPGEITQPALYAACRALVDAANEKGGGDNITVLLVAIHPE